MEHHLRTVLLEDLVHAVRVSDVADHEVAAVEQGPALDGELHGVEGGLVAVEQHEARRGEPVELAGELRADGATGAGDEHPLPGHVPGDRVDVGVDLVAAEEVGVGHRADVAGADLGAVELAGRREDHQPQAAVARQVRVDPDERRVGGGDGEQGDLGVVAGGHGRKVVAGAADGDVADAQVALGRVVVDERHRQVAAGGVAHHGGDDLLAALAGADDHDPLQLLALRAEALLVEEAPDVADPGAGAQHDRAGDERHRERDRAADVRAGQEEGDDPEDAGGHDDGRDEGGDLLERPEAPAPLVEAASRAADHEDDRRERGEPEDLLALARGDREVVPEGGGQHDRDAHGGGVGQHLEPASRLVPSRLHQHVQPEATGARVLGGQRIPPPEVQI